MSGSRYSRPFLVTWPKVPEFQPLTDQEVVENNERILATLPAIVPERNIANIPTTVPVPIPENNDDLRINILKNIHNDMFLGVAARLKTFEHNGKRISNETGKKMLEEISNIVHDRVEMRTAFGVGINKLIVLQSVTDDSIYRA